VTAKPLITTLFFGTAAVAGPAAAIVWPDSVKWVAVIGYEVVLFLAGMLGGVAGDLKKRWQARAVDQVDQAFTRKFSRFGQRYRQQVRGMLEFVDLKGLATIGDVSPDLDDVFVDVSVDFSAPHEVPAGLLADVRPALGDQMSLGDLLNPKRPVFLAVLGAPGSGKTTLLRHTARRVLETRRRVPVLLFLRDHVSAITNGTSLPNLLRQTLINQEKLEPKGWFEQKLRRGRCVVLLDGLDEVARDSERRVVADWIERQMRQFSRSSFVITSRPHGYQKAPLEGVAVLRVRSFTPDQVRQFIHGWYLAVFRQTTKANAKVKEKEQAVARLADTETEDLLRRLDNAPALADLTANPLLLTMIVYVHRYHGALPGSRAGLYGDICQVMLWRRHDAKKLTNVLQGEKKEAVLRGLAYSMMVQRLSHLERHGVLDAIKIALRRSSGKVTAEEFLADVSSNGLLVEHDVGEYAFAHLTFQEFLAASYIRERPQEVKTLVANVHDVWWRETTLLYTANSEADAIVKACLANDSVTALSLAFDCAEQRSSDLDPSLRGRLNQLITEALEENADPSRRVLASEVLLTRHLRVPARTANGGRVCVAPITRKLYFLFRQDVPGRLPDGPGVFEPDDDPVTGVWRKDATDFAGWVNLRIGSELKYRPPTYAEMIDPVVRRAVGVQQSVWVSGGEAPEGRLWKPLPHLDPQSLDPNVLAEHVGDDLRTMVDSLTSKVERTVVLKSGNRAADWLQQIAFVRDQSEYVDLPARYGFALAGALSRAYGNQGGDTDNPWLYEFVLQFILSANLGRTSAIVELDELAALARQTQKTNQRAETRNAPTPQ
jgi:hypothetical protein